jgi:hypothetical protein
MEASKPWYEKGYPGGPMVAVKGFPRPLYPLSAAPTYQPSVDGSDVEAYKRTISRAGRWVWQAFDQAYSNGFANGKGPNVIDTGVAGVQRQQGHPGNGLHRPEHVQPLALDHHSRWAYQCWSVCNGCSIGRTDQCCVR